MKVTVRNILCLAMLYLCMSCTLTDDDGDDYEYTGLVAEMCDVHTSEARQLVAATTDTDTRLSFAEPLNVSWAKEQDTDYRALLYYNKENNGNTVRPIRAQQALILTPKTMEDAKDWYDNRDPVSLATAWFAKNGKYLNLCIDFKSGSADSEDARQTVGIVCEKVTTSATGNRYHYRLCHAQNGVPTYYTVSQYASIPTEEIQSGDVITLDIQTWDGVLTKDFIKP